MSGFLSDIGRIDPSVVERIEKERVMSERISAYNKAIEDTKATQPKYDELAVLWKNLAFDRMFTALKKNYLPLGFSDDQLTAMANLDVGKYRESLSEENFKNQLDDLHNQSVNAAVSQLVYERDNPESADQPNPEAANQSAIESVFVALLEEWLGNRIKSNIEGAKNENGEGAKILRATLGISIEDIRKHGILGGENSYLRKIVPTWSDNGGVLGGENSFFRKNLGIKW